MMMMVVVFLPTASHPLFTDEHALFLRPFISPIPPPIALRHLIRRACALLTDGWHRHILSNSLLSQARGHDAVAAETLPPSTTMTIPPSSAHVAANPEPICAAPSPRIYDLATHTSATSPHGLLPRGHSSRPAGVVVPKAKGVQQLSSPHRERICAYSRPGCEEDGQAGMHVRTAPTTAKRPVQIPSPGHTAHSIMSALDTRPPWRPDTFYVYSLVLFLLHASLPPSPACST